MCICCCSVASVVSDSVQPHRRPIRLPRPWDSPGKNTGVGCHFLLQYVYMYMNKLRSKTETNVTIYIVTEQNVIYFPRVYKWYKYEEWRKTVDCGLKALTATLFLVRTNVTVRHTVSNIFQFLSLRNGNLFSHSLNWGSTFDWLSPAECGKSNGVQAQDLRFWEALKLIPFFSWNAALTPSCKEADLVNVEKNLSTRVNSGHQWLDMWVKP